MSKKLNISLIAITLAIIFIYGIIIIITFNTDSWIFSPYDPPPPGDEDEVERVGGKPKEISEEEVEKRKAIFAEPILCDGEELNLGN